MSPFMLAQVRAIGASEVAEPTLVRLLAFVQRRNMGLKLRVCRRGISTPIAYIRSVARMRPLMVIFRLIGGKCLAATFETASVGPVTSMA